MRNKNSYDDDIIIGGRLAYFWQKIKSIFATKEEVKNVQTSIDELTDTLDTFLNGDSQNG